MAMNQQGLQEEIAKAQQLQQQLQMIMSQKQQLEVKSKDLERALDEVNRLEEETPVYKEVGEILVQVEDKEELISELEDDKESTDVRLKSLKGKEEKLRDQFKEIQEKLSTQMGGMQQGPQGGA
ncbi:MAG: prefoldin subunit beta [Thermoplasmatota archaeon]